MVKVTWLGGQSEFRSGIQMIYQKRIMCKPKLFSPFEYWTILAFESPWYPLQTDAFLVASGRGWLPWRYATAYRPGANPIKLFKPYDGKIKCLNCWLGLWEKKELHGYFRAYHPDSLTKACCHALGRVCKFVQRCKKFYRIGPSTKRCCAGWERVRNSPKDRFLIYEQPPM